MLSEGNFDKIKYEIIFIDPNNKILRVMEKGKKDDREESKKRVVTFDESDLDKGLLYAEADKIKKKHGITITK